MGRSKDQKLTNNVVVEVRTPGEIRTVFADPRVRQFPRVFRRTTILAPQNAAINPAKLAGLLFAQGGLQIGENPCGKGKKRGTPRGGTLGVVR